ncbi:HepT-like ribonuclease domain-containing protein [Caminibacter pacificus]
MVDIFIAIDKIKRYIQPFKSATELLYDEKSWDAVIRELEIIGEATNKLLKYDFLENDYRIIVDFRNIIVHEYFGINENIVWEVVNEYLDEFKQKLINESKKLDLSLAIKAAKKENKHNKNVLNFLKELEDVLSS